VAWPLVSAAFDLFCAAEDELAVEGTRRLAALGLEVGESAPGGRRARGAPPRGRRRARGARADSGSTVLVLLTEGVTDPATYARIVS
jgi:hypothetical protein